MPAALPMAARHALGLERLAEMSGKLVEIAYQRALVADDEDGAQERAMLLFDRLAPGFRMSIALEARMGRDRRRDAAGLTARPRTPRPRPPCRRGSPAHAPPARRARPRKNAKL